MAGQIVPVILNVRGDLDTANPVTDRAPGTLVRARDLHPRYFGPRTGSLAFTRAWEGPGNATLYDEITFTQATGTTFATGRSFEEQFRDLGTKFTLDLFIRYEDLAYAVGIDIVKLYGFAAGGIGRIDIDIMGPAHADHERVRVGITTSNTRSSAATIVRYTGTTRINAGTAQTDKTHIRVVRDGASSWLYVNGALDGSTSSISAVNPINGAIGSVGSLTIADNNSSGSTIRFKGKVLAAVLRDGAFRTAPVENVFPANPWGKNVHHYYLGRNYALGGAVDHFLDCGRFQAHANIVGAEYSVTSANDDTAPAPCVVQGFRSWTTRTGRTATAVTAGGILSTEYVA